MQGATDPLEPRHRAFLVATALAVFTLFSLLKVVADPMNQLPGITFWLLGGGVQACAD